MIDKVVDRTARAVELLLAFSFIFAVLLNFANVVGRYALGYSLLGADEYQIFIMIGMTFIGAAIVTRRNQHLRMDVLARMMPQPLQKILGVIEHILIMVLAAFVVSQSYFYALQMFRIGRTSDTAGIPMWIPHSTIAVGFALMFLVAALNLIRPPKRTVDAAAKLQAPL